MDVLPETFSDMSPAVVWARRHRFAMAIGYSLIFLLSTTLVMYMRHNRNVAFRGDVDAARKMILPAFEPLLLLFSAVSLTYSTYLWLTLVLTEINEPDSMVETEVYYSGRLFVMIVTMVYMYQKSVTTPALQRAVAIMLVVCTYNLPIVWYTTSRCSESVAYYVPTFTRLPVPTLFLWAFINPPARASKRTIREYCAFVFTYYSLFFTSNELTHQGQVDTGFAVAFIKIFWGSTCPLVIWRLLKADTEHWRGLGQRACVLQSLFRQKHNLDERISSRGLHLLIEMHRKFIIDFAHLELKQRIGVGSSAVVFNGVLNSKTPVAIKVYTPTVLVDDTVAEFSHEAALCGALVHPNIVKFYGMCVCPPTICLVSELCQGSLDDITRAIARRKHPKTRQQMIINLQYMIDAARAVAYLHSFSPAFLHRDLKPANFLVDARCFVKLTDFGESRSLPKVCQAGAGYQQPAVNYNARVSAMESTWSVMQTPTTTTTTVPTPQRNAMTVRGTADYMAPELIQGKAGTALYGEAADVYSLAITLWDILHPWGEKYPAANNNHLKIFESVLSDSRPRINDSCHPQVRNLLCEAWDPQPDRRPSAQYIVTTLESLKRELLSDVAVSLATAGPIKTGAAVIAATMKKQAATKKSISGQQLMQRMLQFSFVETAEEARRMGNGLMSAGFLHHNRHSESFATNSELFVFDNDVTACPPSPNADARGVLSAKVAPQDMKLFHADAFSTSDARLSSTSVRKHSAGSHYFMKNQLLKQPDACACRKLGRGQGPMRALRAGFRRNKKWFPIGGENVLTEELLGQEHIDYAVESTCGDTSPMSSCDLEAAILHHSEGEEDYDDDDGVVHLDDEFAHASYDAAVVQAPPPKSRR